ncbi:phosphotransferase family protein [Maribacter sp. 2307ULW6-5]|uniref:phosphotransferase family protein n=1 Tax=Maribacter sp. 2307ULW6-5 TaxID=3386275 RepID=UPI0039BD25AB
MSAISNTRPIRAGEELPKAKLMAFLAQHGLVSSPHGELSVRQFSNGYSNLTYLLACEGKEFVLRRPPFSAPKRGHDMGREYQVLKHLQPVFGKTPTAFAFSDGALLGAPFYIMSKVEGEILTATTAKQKKVGPRAFQTIGATWLDAFVDLHTIDYREVGLQGLGRPEGYVARQVTNWGKQYLAAATEAVVEAEKVMQWMEEHQPKTYGHTLIHNDFKYDNVVFKDENWTEITAILDWEMCTLGDPLMDLGTSLGYWTTHQDPEFMKQGLPSPTVMEGNPSRTDIVQQYALKSGRDVDHIVFYYAYGLFKIAVIAQQIYYRYRQGHTQDPKFAQLNKASALCCATAWQAIQKKQIDHLYT